MRATTPDRADLRLLVDVHVAVDETAVPDVERAVLALVVPAAARWVRRHPLAALERALEPELHEVGAAVRDELATLGVGLLRLELVAAEHLLASPSGARADGPG